MSLKNLEKVWPVFCLSAFLSTNVQAGEIEVSESQAKHSAIAKPIPAMPPMARSLKMGGHVEVKVFIDGKGEVTDVKAVQGPAILSNSVIQAVKNWKFTPFKDNAGGPSSAVATLSFDFKP